MPGWYASASSWSGVFALCGFATFSVPVTECLAAVRTIAMCAGAVIVDESEGWRQMVQPVAWFAQSVGQR